MEFMNKVANVVTLVFVISSMLAVGLGFAIREILAPLRNGRLVSRALLANFVVMPIAALAIGRLLKLDKPLSVGLLLLGTAAGAPFLPKLASSAKGNLAFSVALMVLLTTVTVVYMPLILPLLLEGVTVNSMRIANSLLFLMLLPLGVGLVLKARFERVADAVRPLLNRVSSLTLVLLVVLLLLSNVQNVISLFGTRGILASIVFLIGGVGVGWLLGGPAFGLKSVLALGTAQRNIAAALVVAGADFDDPKVLVMVVVVSVVGLLILMPLARLLGTRSPERFAKYPSEV